MDSKDWKMYLQQFIDVGSEKPTKNGQQKNIYEDEFQDVPLEDNSSSDIEESSGEEQDRTQQFNSSIIIPQQKLPYNKSMPPLQLVPIFINGFTCLQSTQNVLYCGSERILFAAATVGVTMDTTTRQQSYFGWVTETDNSGQNYEKHHKFQIVCLTRKGNVVLTGSSGINPEICAWDSFTMQPMFKTYQGKNTKAVACLCFFQDNMFLSVYRQSRQLNSIVVWSMDGKKLHASKFSGSIYTIASERQQIAVASSEGAYLYEYRQEQLVVTSNYNQYTTSVCYFNDSAVFGCLDGKIIIRNRKYQLHDGCILTMIAQPCSLYTSGADNVVREWSQDMVQLRQFNLQSCARSIDINGGRLLLALQNGRIIEVGEKTKTIMNCHSVGQVCGLAFDKKSNCVISAGDDNKILRLSLSGKQVLEEHFVCADKKRNKKYQKESFLYCSQQCRAIDIYNDLVAYGTNYGKIYLLHKNKPAVEVASIKDRIMCLKFAQDGKKLAVGCCDDCVYVFEVLKDQLHLICRLFGHEGDVCSVDFSEDGAYLRSCSVVGQLRYWDLCIHKEVIMNSPKQPLEDKEKVKLLTWCSLSKFSYETKLLWEEVKDTEFVNVVKQSNNKVYIAVGEDDNCVRIYMNPCIQNRFRRYRVHAGNVMNICWAQEDSILATVGGPDHCLILWKVIYQ